MKKIILTFVILLGVLNLALSQGLDLSTNPNNFTSVNLSANVEFLPFVLNPQSNVELTPIEGMNRAYFNQNYYLGFTMPENLDVKVYMRFPDNVIAGMAAYVKENEVLTPINMTFIYDVSDFLLVKQSNVTAGQTVIIRLWFNQDMAGNNVQFAFEKTEPVVQTRNISVDINTYTPQQLVQDILINGCLTAENVTYTGDSEAIGYFSGNIGASGFDEGVILTSGKAVLAEGPDDVGVEGNNNNTGSDADLAALNPGFTINDAAVLEFDFVPASDTLVFQYIFGSEEFPEFVNGSFNDVFGFFLSGPGINGPYSNNAINIAELPNGQSVTIDNLYNSGLAPAGYYVGSTAGNGGEGNAYSGDIQYDGASVPLTAMAMVQACETYHIKLAIGDAGDGAYDSGVFFKASSFTSGVSYTATSFNPWNTADILNEGCITAIIFSRVNQNNMNEPVPIPLGAGGTAMPGVDYSAISDTFFIQPGNMSDTLFIEAFADGIAEGTETILFSFTSGCPCDLTASNLEIELVDELEWTPTITNTGPICTPGDAVTLTLNLPPGVDLALVDWLWLEDSTTGYTTTVYPAVTTTYELEWTFPCQTITVSTTVLVDETPVIDLGDDFTSCSQEVDLDAGMVAGNTGHWEAISGPGTAMFDDINASETSVHVDAIGTYTFVWYEYNLLPDCEVSDTIQILFYDMDYTSNFTNVSCFGGNNGSAQITVTGGTAPYTYLWSNDETQAALTNLEAGAYTVVATDDSGCSVSETFVITQPDEINISFNGDAQICEGQSVDLNINASGGVQPYTYFWSTGGAYAQGAANMTAAPNQTTNYSVYVADANNCNSVTMSANIAVSEAIALDLETQDNSCFGTCDGRAELTVIGGLPPFDFSWDSDNRILEDICAGNYQVTVVDQIGCSADVNFTITEPTELELDTYSTPASCSGVADGLAWVEAAGGVPPYSYIWNNGNQTNEIAVQQGTYYVTVEDANNCRKESAVFVSAPDVMQILSDETSPICVGGSATLGVVVVGGTAPYDYSWVGSDNSTGFGENFTVSPNVNTDYSLTITDANGCEAYQDFTVEVYPELQITALNLDNDTVCPNQPVRLFIDVEGGNGGPYTLQLQNGDTITSPLTLELEQSETISITLTDDCETPAVTESIHIPVWTIPENAFVADKYSGCPPLSVEFREVNENNGNTYLWSYGDNEFGESQTSVHTYQNSGLYTVSLVVKDVNGCENKQTIPNIIDVFPQPSVDFYATPSEVSIINPQIQFNAVTENTDSLYWIFGDGDSSYYQVDVIHLYPGIGEYNVMLVGENEYACRDTAYKNVRVVDEVTFWVPTAFSPNGDGVNDCFRVCGNAIDENDFYFAVYDRWGEIVFETDVYNSSVPCDVCFVGAWDGKYHGKQNKGKNTLMVGTYSWYTKFKDKLGTWHEYDGVVKVVR